MTRVQIRLRLQRPLDEKTLSHLAAANAIYGIQHLKVSPAGDAMEVEFDASRLKTADVVSALSAAGVPVAAN